ncbi:MAG: hypothetical protein ACJAVI_002098 [Candidatus Azotimanducaceae bacterium]|jgi:hypothetical protein
MTNRAMLISILVALTLFGSYLLWEKIFEPVETVALAPEPEVQLEKKIPALKVIVTECRRLSERTHMKGYVENTGNAELSFVTVHAIWLNKSGLAVSKSIVYAVKDSVLVPGDKREFESVIDSGSVSRCNAEILDYWA